jgi:hypothetical protein
MSKPEVLIDKSSHKSEQDKTIAPEMLKYDTDDRKSDREMQIVALGQDDVFSKRYTYYLSTAIFAMPFVFEILLFFVTIPTGNSEIVYMAFGTFIGIASTVAAFFLEVVQALRRKVMEY